MTPAEMTAAAHKANFVQAAYAMFATGQLMPPPDGRIAAAGYQLTQYLLGSDFEQQTFYGFIAQAVANPGDVVLAVRGTQTPKEWLLDFAALPVPFRSAPGGGFVALGFDSIFRSFQLVDSTGAHRNLADAVTQINAARAITSFTVLGHSLGAALATLAGAELALLNVAGVQSKLDVTTFASPRVGLLDFAAAFNRAVPVSFRIWNMLDIVPETPTFPYIHVNGLGDKIVQTPQQIQQLLVIPNCEHSLSSYQWLLDPAEFALQPSCDHSRLALARAADPMAPDAALGADALYRAAFGR